MSMLLLSVKDEPGQRVGDVEGMRNGQTGQFLPAAEAPGDPGTVDACVLSGSQNHVAVAHLERSRGRSVKPGHDSLNAGRIGLFRNGFAFAQRHFDQ